MIPALYKMLKVTKNVKKNVNSHINSHHPEMATVNILVNSFGDICLPGVLYFFF